MAVAGTAYRETSSRSEADDLAEVERWYRDALAEPAVLPAGRWAPVRIGPTWQVDERGHWLLPECSLGWAHLAWSGLHLQHAPGEPWTYTLEQARALLWWYEIDERGRFTHTDWVLQRLKGWGKDPLGACVCLGELVGPCRFGGWSGDRPIVVDCPEAWVATAAVGLEQTKNTMRLLPGLPTAEAIERYRLQIGKESAYALGDERVLQAVTSSPRSLQGRRHTFVLLNEALALDTPIPTPDGWTTMGEVEPGDRLVGADGRPTRVTHATDVQVDRTCYRVHFADGTSVVASDGHLWQTKVAESSAKPRVRTTQEIADDPRSFRVPRAGGLQAEDVDLPLDPYVLGLWLGDGDSRNAVITASSEDADETMALVRARGYTAKRCASTKAPRFYVSVPGARKCREDRSPVPGVRARLADMELLGDKHVPAEYLRAGTEQRLALLRGLMDSDGCVTAQGFCVFIATDDGIADATVELLRSLGQAPRRTWTKDARSRRGGYHRIGFTPRGIVPVSLPRKVARVRSAKAESDWLSIVLVEQTESVPVRCVAVDAPDHLFLAGEGWTVTHNTHEWVASNEGHAMTGVLEDNAAKSPGGAARTARITNAPMPGEDSVAERDREAWQSARDGAAEDPGILYDSLEAHPDAPLIVTVRVDPDNDESEIDDDATRAATREAIGEVVETVRGDASWLDVDRIVARVLDVRSAPSRSRRYWYNQLAAAEDARFDPADVDRAARPDVVVAGRERVVLFGDLSKSDDASALVGCRLSDGHVFTVEVWTPGRRGDGQSVSRAEVAVAIRRAIADFSVDACWIDPGEMTEEETGRSYWQVTLDELHRDLAGRLDVWASPKSSTRPHALVWDMRAPSNDKVFTEAVEAAEAEFESGELTHDGHPLLVRHLKNARRRPGRYGVGMGKEHRESRRKVDGAVALVGARMLRRHVLNREATTRRRTGFVA